MASQRVAVVTGGNRGIGLEVCRQLAATGLKVVLTARDGAKARLAAAELSRERLSVVPYALDVTDPAAANGLVAFVEGGLGQVAVLVNNAGVFLDQEQGGVDVPMSIVRETLETNLLGAWKLAQALIPAMKRNRYGRIVNVSSGMGAMSEMAGGYSAYRISKASLNALTRILADELRGTNVLVNAVCPGWVQTEMGGPRAPRPVAEGADSIVWLATLPDGGPSGQFFRDRRQIPW
jgi:NAD(P)-dependent dehydrogenase (short-subunit alcohol dehydrogenase family)